MGGRPTEMAFSSRRPKKVMVYFWDDRDGAQLQGWWVSPEVGGANVWAMNPEGLNDNEPPQKGWKVPWHGEVDSKVVCAKQLQTITQKRPGKTQWGQFPQKHGRWASQQGGKQQWGQQHLKQSDSPPKQQSPQTTAPYYSLLFKNNKNKSICIQRSP